MPPAARGLRGRGLRDALDRVLARGAELAAADAAAAARVGGRARCLGAPRYRHAEQDRDAVARLGQVVYPEVKTMTAIVKGVLVPPSPSR